MRRVTTPIPESAESGEAPPLPTLADLRPGGRAVVEWVDTDCRIGRRLLDLGLVPGTPVTVLRRAPLGDPVEYELRGYRLCLRRSEALRVHVKPA